MDPGRQVQTREGELERCRKRVLLQLAVAVPS